MAQDKIKQKDAVKQAQVVDMDEHQKTKEPRKLEMFLVTLPTAVKKFADTPDMKKSDRKYKDPSEEPYGMIFALVDQSIKLYVAQLSPSRIEEYLMDTSDNFVAFLFSMFVAHFGGRGNRANWVAAGCFLTGIAAIVFAVPFLNFEIIKLSVVKEELCEEGKLPKVCEPTVLPHKSICIFIFIFGQCLHGIAGLPLYILATSFIFDHVPTNSSGLYIALVDAALGVGYCLGFIGGMLNFKMSAQEVMQAVGHRQRIRILQRGWWRTFIFVAVFAFCTTLPLLGFPSSLPGARQIRLEKSQEPPTFDRRLKNKEIKNNLKSVLHATWIYHRGHLTILSQTCSTSLGGICCSTTGKAIDGDLQKLTQCLIRNPLVLSQVVCKFTEFTTFKSSAVFLPQYLQTRFLIRPSSASMLTGVFILPGSIFGHFFGGFIVHRMQMNNKNKLKFLVVASFVSIVLFLLTFFVECEISKFAGINDDYDRLGIIGNLTAPCNVPCGCTTSEYNPVCGRDETQYFSPCFAGCKATKKLRKEKTYYNCSCIKEGLTTADNEGQYIDAVSGTCNTRCLTLPLFFAFYFTATFLSSFCSIPSALIVIQSVPTSWNSMSLGLMSTVWRFTGSVPAPILFAATSDFTCQFWGINECGEKVRCWIYNTENLVYTFKTVWINMQILSGLSCLYGVYRHDYVVKGDGKKAEEKTGQSVMF
ncbi:solute carrier organic anion transporter family, member 6d1 isoform X3 [Mus musculus]|uniref:solute carrier organic anion transporter family, member 6d1 isoform X3 n=1 Tax=Mus musculus TaxID=10090 RepID=UPI0007EDA70F|nr:solute carrier organic anion transporter family, member 6d1 isoform X3 [Mus musculus]|eukprot:XP_017167782.1 PREDICTED: solute carrier organic anion transporter family, member 6d1 isoform X3 [Mus musculus]